MTAWISMTNMGFTSGAGKQQMGEQVSLSPCGGLPEARSGVMARAGSLSHRLIRRYVTRSARRQVGRPVTTARPERSGSRTCAVSRAGPLAPGGGNADIYSIMDSYAKQMEQTGAYCATEPACSARVCDHRKGGAASLSDALACCATAAKIEAMKAAKAQQEVELRGLLAEKEEAKAALASCATHLAALEAEVKHRSMELSGLQVGCIRHEQSSAAAAAACTGLRTQALLAAPPLL